VAGGTIENYPALVKGKKYYFKASLKRELKDIREYEKEESNITGTWRKVVETEDTGERQVSRSDVAMIEILDISESEEGSATVVARYETRSKVKYSSRCTITDKITGEVYKYEWEYSSSSKDSVNKFNFTADVHSYGASLLLHSLFGYSYYDVLCLPIDDDILPITVFAFVHSSNITKYLESIKDCIENSESKDKYRIELGKDKPYLKLVVDGEDFRNTQCGYYDFGNWSNVKLTFEMEYDAETGILKKVILDAEGRFSSKYEDIWEK